MYRIRLDKAPRPCWFEGWLDADDTIPCVVYQEKRACLFDTATEAQTVAECLSEWVPTVEEGE